jgi:arsenate reductase
MAEAFVRKYSGNTIDAFSAGLAPRPIHEMAIEVMNEVCCDIRNQRSKPVSEFLGKENFDLAIFVCEKAERNCPYIYPFILNRISWPFSDPASVQGSRETRLAAFRNVRDAIETKVKEWIPTTKEGRQ